MRIAIIAMDQSLIEDQPASTIHRFRLRLRCISNFVVLDSDQVAITSATVVLIVDALN